ncbi:MAG: aspartate carbamoyltransferase catalytic subunit [Deltaproteobacteria bacterium]|nr:aspartate carbamoyltransferase catalytic subunit [Deltaproteobacteria bacterium]
MAFTKHHLLRIADLTSRDIELILSTARSLKGISFRSVKKVPALRGKTVLNCFFESSTRTRTSFEIAAKRLSADTINFSSGGSSMSKGESVLDTIRNLNAMQPDIVVMRHQSSGLIGRIAAQVPQCHFINAGDGMHEHPTQALLDAMTIQEAKGKIRGLRVVILGDVTHSRVARSNILLLRKLGAHVRVAGPSTLLPPEVDALGVTHTTSVAAATEGADVVMVLRIQQERLGEFAFPSVREYARYYGLSAQHLERAAPHVVVLHPGPVNRGVELSPDVADGSSSLILDQVENGIAVRMASLYLLSGVREPVQ